MRASALAAEREELFALLLAERGLGAEGRSAIRRRTRSGPAPLSFGQEQLWFLEQLHPEAGAYNQVARLAIEPRVGLGRFAAALGQVCARHEILRSRFPTTPAGPVQVAGSTAAPRWFALDLGALSRADRERVRDAAGAAWSALPFDLERGPLLRILVVSTGTGARELWLVVHHIVCDEWSLGVLQQDLALAYRAVAAGRPPEWEELPIQYADFAAWQREALHSQRLEELMAPLRERLQGLPGDLGLPLDRPRPPRPSHRGEAASVWIEPQHVVRLEALAGRTRASLFTVLLAAFKTLLALATDRHDVVVGTPVANRSHRETEPLVGFFVNTLVLRTRLGGAPGFEEIVGRTREVVLEAFASQELPFELLVRELSPTRELSHHPLFQVVFSLQNAAGGASGSHDDLWQPLPQEIGVAQFDLTVDLSSSATGALHARLEFALDLFDGSTIGRLLTRYRRLLVLVARNPRLKLSELDLVEPAERRQLLAASRGPAARAGDLEAVPQRILRLARERPEARAAVCAEGSLSYGDLADRACRLAGWLRGHGAGSEGLVALYLDRGPELAIGLLAVGLAGAAFLLLDPSETGGRPATILAEARPSVMLTVERHAARLGSTGAARVLALDSERSWVACEPEAFPEPHPESAAYVFYTSGSTGRPRGVIVPHRAWAGYSSDFARQAGLAADDRFLQLASLGFDVLIEEVFPVWLAGGAVVFRPNGPPLGCDEIEETIAAREVTTVELPGALFDLWVRSRRTPPRPLPASLRRVIVGCEPPAADSLELWQEEGIPLVHVFGLTEVAVTSTLLVVPPLPSPGLATLPIGRPTSETSAWVLREDLRLQPVGVPGELYLGGAGLARGYLRQPALTAERFVPDSVGNEPGGRLYRTGDRVRWLASGMLEHLGRLDAQVKVRGFRVETGEVEAALRAHPATVDCAVVAKEIRPGDTRLVAWLELDGRGGGRPEDFRAWLRERLPEYMVPSFFELVPGLPRTPSGKPDRVTLAARAVAVARAEAPAEEPASGALGLVGETWRAVLGVERIEPEDDFFALGGHSLLAIQVLSRLREATGIALPLRVLFENPTAAALGRALALAGVPATGRRMPPLVVVDREADLPLSFSQERLWAFDQLHPGRAVYNVPLAVRASGSIDCRAMARALAEVARRQEVLRTGFEVRRAKPVQRVHRVLPIDFAVVDLTRLAAPDKEAEAERLASSEAGRPFALGRPPLLRLRLLRLANDEHGLLLTLHHIVSDDRTVELLLKELAVIYSAFLRAAPSPLPELPYQYADFAVWQRQMLDREELERQLSFWRRKLAGADTGLALPLDRPRPVLRSFRGGALVFELGGGVSQRLRELARESSATLFMELLAAFKALLFRITGQGDILVGTGVANRDHVELEEVFGFFINTLVIRTQVSAETTFRQLLARVRQEVLAAHDHRDVPFELVLETLGLERRPDRPPLFQVMFEFENAVREELQMPGLQFGPLEASTHTAKFDLVLGMSEGGDGLLGSFEYDAELFEPGTIAEIAGAFQRLVRELVEHPDLPMLDFQLGAVSMADGGEAAAEEAFVFEEVRP